MGTSSVLSLDELLAPISEEAPAGEDIRADASPSSAYYAVKDARVAARAAERANIDDASMVPPEWQTVIDTGRQILATKAKDLEVAAWMVEALVRTDGFVGLRDGFRLIEGLVTRFWDGLYPLPDEDGIATRVGPVAGLNGEGAEGTLILPIRKVPLTHGSEQAYALWQFEQATELERQSDAAKKAAKVADGAVSMEAFTASVNETPAAAFGELVADIEAAQAALRDMGAALDQAAGTDSPSCSKIRETLEAAVGAIRYFATDKLATLVPDTEVVADGEAGTETASGDSGEVVLSRKKKAGYETRDEAMAELTRIAAFFREHEPHSPISYTLDEVVRRGRLSLLDLLAELIPDAEVRRMFLLASGIKPQFEGSDTSSEF